MNERGADSGRATAFFAALIVLVSVLALAAPGQIQRIEREQASASPTTPATLPVVEVWLSTADRRLKLAQQHDIPMTARGSQPADVTVDLRNTYQTMVGFGAAMTDASAWLLRNKLNPAQRKALLDELYGPPPHLNFNMMRLTIGSSDFSLNVYTLDDIFFGQTDPDLKHFNIAPNLPDLVPVVQEALAINPGIRILATPWSAPAWMKVNTNVLGGELSEDDESVYADYLIKYVDAYRRHGIPIFGLSLQNEPAFQPITYPGMQMPAAQRARIIANYLGPRLAKRTPRTQILEWDHNWSHPEQPLEVLSHPDAARYVDGVAWHCYEGNPYNQGKVHRAFPDKDTYMTECSGGDWASAANGELIWFSRNLLIESIRQWARGVVYWNLALDENHGPHFGGCSLCKGVVLIDSRTGEVSRNDEYYALAHFSRFVLPDASRVQSNQPDKDLANVAFWNATDGSIVLVMVNSHKDARHIAIAEGQARFEYTMPAQSVATFVWMPDKAVGLAKRAIWWVRRAL
ncbi:glycoside hydrolase family 30 beta sandwich domain-containing protein [Luteibacter sp. PPL201]|uniref:Glycoside hydrolase family 30 beta sandwich domain-containing protein n=1 Tax=Luteibacter sahnii TaxID=3021977 RepID=A0ABT6BDQ7_9GAMM